MMTPGSTDPVVCRFGSADIGARMAVTAPQQKRVNRKRTLSPLAADRYQERTSSLLARRLEPPMHRTRLVFALVLALVLLAAPLARGTSTSLVLSQVYSGGGNSGATYANDFVELLNR